MDLIEHFFLLVFIIITCRKYKCNTLADQDLFYKVDGSEKLEAIFDGDAPPDFCVQPKIPKNGNIMCGKLSSDLTRFVCISYCDIGFEFPNKKKNGKIICNLITGIWMPRSEFPDCGEKTVCNPPCKNGGTCIKDNVCACPGNFTGEACQQRLCDPPCQNGGTCLEKNTCSCSPLFEGDRCETDICKKPSEPRNGKMWCSVLINTPNILACVADCEDGYRFPNGENKPKHICNPRTKIWIPKYEFPDCEAVCDPPCENGGTCEKRNECLCTANFEGDRCETEKAPEGCVEGWTEYLNSDNPEFSDIGDDESLDRIREFQPVCTAGVIKGIECKAIVNGKLVDYREVGTLGLRCSKETGFICNENIRKKKCEDFAVKFFCECAECDPPCQNGGTCAKGNECICTPNFHGDRCEIVQCDPPCQNGGMCEEGNQCNCTPDFDGERCEIAKAIQGCVNGWTEYFNTDNPDFSDIGDDESLDRIREFQPVCSGSIITDVECKAIVRGKLVDYKEVGTLGLLCSKEAGFICDENMRQKTCEDFAVRFRCDCAACNPPCQNGGSCAGGNTCVCTPNFEGHRCEHAVQCDPPCQNGGMCEEGNECSCTSDFEGERCEIAKAIQGCVNGWTEYFNTDNPDFSDIGDDESLDRIREFQPVCSGGIITDVECKAIVRGKLVDYKEVGTLGLLCSKEAGFICDENMRQKTCEDFAVRFRCNCVACNPPCQNGGSCAGGNICVCTPNFEGHRCEHDVCKTPSNPRNGKVKCSQSISNPNRKSCIVECEMGYRFPHGGKKLQLICDARTNIWMPESEFPDCEALCNPPCVNGGSCVAGNHCICTPDFQGNRCENAQCDPPCQNGGICEKGNECLCTQHFAGDRCEIDSSSIGCVPGWTDYLNTDNPTFSDIGDDERLDKIREFQPVCTGGIIMDVECKAIVNAKLVDYREVGTSGLNCSKDIGFICNENIRKKICEDFVVRFFCECAVCNPPCQNGGSCAAKNICVCTPDFEGERCEKAVCNPPCRNRGSCVAGNKCICTSDFEGNRCENDIICKMPSKPRNAKMWCSKLITDPNMYVCIAECEEGYSFPNGKKKARHACNLKSKQWITESEFPDCKAKSSQICISGWTEYFNTDNPAFSDIGDDERLDRIRGLHSVCPGGIVNDIECKAISNGQLVDYKEVGIAGLECSNEIGFICDKNARMKNCEDFTVRFLCGCDVCTFPPKPRNAKMTCSGFITDKNRYVCLAKCEDGYKFPNGKIKLQHTCDARSNKWIPEYKFPDCEAECDPPCQNGATCEKGNKCFCSPNFKGDRCENAKSSQDCNSGWTDYMNTDNPEFSEIGDDESLDRIRGFEPFCTGGIIKDIECKAIVDGKYVDYKEVGTTGLDCSKDFGFICDEDIRNKKCEDFAVRFLCECDTICNPTCKNGGSCVARNNCICTPDFEGDRCENAVCNPTCKNGGSCAAGNECICTPDFEGDRCESAKPPEGCNPPCQNGGMCEKGNKCICTPHFDGDLCENEKPAQNCTDGWTAFINTDFPEFSVVGDDESLDRIREFQPVCTEGIIKDIDCKAIIDGKFVDYKQRGTVGLKCSKDTGFTCDVEERGECEDFAVRFLCECELPLMEFLPLPNPENRSVTLQSETYACEISRNVIQTFDGYAYQYDTCNHVLMKERTSESFSVIVHRICPSESPVNCYRIIIIKVDALAITFGPGIDTVTVEETKVPLRSLWLVSQKFPHIQLKQNTNSLVFKSLKYEFDVTWDKLDNSKIKVSKLLINGTDGLCGVYNGKVEDDLKMPNGIMARSDEEFGDSWAIESGGKCSKPNYTPGVSIKANATCEKLREMPFKSCYKMADLNRKIEACFAFMCECLQRSLNNGTESFGDSEKCKCLAFESFAEDCDGFKRQPAPEWRFLHGCIPTCSQGMEWQNCGPGCQLTCDNYHQRSKICNSTCVPGCYCPPGLVRHQNHCVKPNMCQDCICRGHGDHNYITFDGRHYAFQGTCSYVLVQHLTSKDETMNFQILGLSRACPEDTVTSCIQGFKIIWNDQVIQKNIFHPVYLNRKLIKVEETPYDEGGISIIYVPKISTLIHIKKINLVVRYFDQKRGFIIELPSFYYQNKTEGLCGVCNFNVSDDLQTPQGHIVDNIKDFAYSWLRGIYKRKNCEHAPVNVLDPRPGICNFRPSPCEAILDPSPFLKSCQNDVQYSRRPEIYVCRSKFHYAEQCCERGVALDEWLNLSGCDSSCPEGMVYKCSTPCPKTCENYKTYREDDCPFTPQNACTCPEDEVLKLGKCVKTNACEVCDEKGHVVSDVWQVEPCKTCECLPDFSTRCIVRQCPEPPVCGEQETLMKVKKLNDSCCDYFKCVPKPEVGNCEEPKLKECPTGKALVLQQSGKCPVYRCECFPLLCPPIVTPHLDEGESFRMVTTDCCPEVQIACNLNLCAPSPNCSEGFKLSIEKGRCCFKRKCVPQENICVYQHQYDVVNGTQRKLPLERYYDKEYQPGVTWHDGLCRKCNCENSNGGLMTRCYIDRCQTPADFPDADKYIREEVHVPGACCPMYIRKLCVDQGAIYKVGDEWTSPESNLCRTISQCALGSTGEAVLNVKTKCETSCPTDET